MASFQRIEASTGEMPGVAFIFQALLSSSLQPFGGAVGFVAEIVSHVSAWSLYSVTDTPWLILFSGNPVKRENGLVAQDEITKITAPVQISSETSLTFSHSPTEE